MKLTQAQIDRLNASIDIGFSRTAAALSELTQLTVLLDPPVITTQSFTQLRLVLEDSIPGDVAAVHQIFSGRVSGNALLLLSCPEAGFLTNRLTHASALGIPARLDESSREVLAEVGNILLNACLSVLGNLLNVPIAFSVPRVSLGTLDSVMRSFASCQEETQSTLLMRTSFRLQESTTGSCLVIALGTTSIDRLAYALDQIIQSPASYE